MIILRNGEEINAKIVELGVSEVKYKKWSNQNGPVVVAPKSNIFMIRYQNGEKEVFDAQQQAAPSNYNSGNAYYSNSVVGQGGYNLMALGSNTRLSVARKSDSGLSNATTGAYISEFDAQRVLGSNYTNYAEQARRMKSGFKVLICGAVFMVAAPCFIPIMWADLPGLIIGASLACGLSTASLVMIPVGAVKFATGKTRCHRIVNEANNSMTAFDFKKEPVKLNLGFTSNGVGLALNF